MNRNTYDGKIAGLYDLEDTLGRGHFAVVKLARHVFTGEKVAVKVIDKTKLDEVSRSHLFQEVRCMKLVQHPNVVRLYEVIDTQTKLYLILEWGDGGDMYEYIMKHDKGLNEEAAKKYFRQIVHAISYCHKLHVVHRDLKPENVVFFEKLGMVKLTDFGFSNRFYPGQKLETSCGSLAYSAPEILLGDSYDAPAVDVWSLGVILFMLVCGQAPFQEANDSETLTMIMDCKYTIPSYVSPECARLIQKMLIRDPERRSTIEEITNDPWLHSASNVQHADHLPLVSREHLSEEDHNYIIQKMVNGNIATQEEILEAVDQNAYSHITATYYLLAERKLRALRHERAKLLNATHVSDLSALAISPRNPSIPGCPPPENSLPRTVDSLLSPQESRRATQVVPSPVDALDVCTSWVSRNKDGLSTSLSAGSGNVDILVKSKKPTVRLLTHNVNDAAAALSTVDGTDSLVKVNGGDAGAKDAGAKDAGSKSCADVFSFAKNRFKPGNGPNNRKLHSVRSSPQLTLNEIYEEVESDGEPTSATNFLQSGGSNSTISSPSTRVLKTHQSVASPTILRKYEQRRRFKARTASCSSSDASDEDTETRKRKAEELKRIPDWRDRKNRDDDDSDQERGGPGLGGGNSGNNTTGGQTADGRDQRGGANDSNNDKNNKWSKEGHQSYSSSPKRQAPFAVEVVRAGSEELLTQTSRNKKAVLLQSQHIGKSADELCHNRIAKLNKTPSPILAHLRSQGSVSRNLVKTSVASPPPSPLSTPNITSLRQSKTLNQLNRFISPPNSMLGSPVLDIGDKENHSLSRHCAVPGPLQLLNFKRPGKWRPPSYPQVSSSSTSSLTSVNNHLPNSSLSANNNLVVATASVEPVKTSSRYRLGLYRLLRHAPNLGNSSNESSGGSGNDSSNGGVTKRWDINRNGFAGHSSAAANNRASNYGVAPYRVNTTPTSSPSHSKCCSLC